MRIIMGKHPIRMVLKKNAKNLKEVFTSKKEDEFTVELKSKGICVTVVSKKRLSTLANSDSHQGFLAKVSVSNIATCREFLDNSRKKSLVVMCDSIQDPQNFGSIIRACECFGVSGIIYSKNRNVGITPVVTKASVGGSELVNLIPVSNLHSSLLDFKEKGFCVIASCISKNAQDLYSVQMPEKTLIILGAEGAGISPILKKNSDLQVFIPMLGLIDSLNVSQATSLFLSKWREQN